MVEVMITVAIIAVLAVIVVPTFTRETRKSKATSEVVAMFGEIGVRQDQYKAEHGSYFNATGACPATTVPTGQDAQSCSSTTWSGLRLRLPQTNLICSYNIVAGTGTGTNNPGGFAFSSPPGAWYYVIATCDGDGNPATNATYFISSISSQLQKLNEGH